MPSREELESRARSAIRTGRQGEIRLWWLAVNVEFDDDREKPSDQDGGVERDAIEVQIAEQVLSERFMQDLGILPSPQDWIRAEAAARGGLSHVAAEMLDLPLTAETRRRKDYKAELRALERLAKGEHKTIRSAARRDRIGRLMEERPHPYADAGTLRRRELRRAELAIGVRGDWRFSEDLEEYKLKHSDRESFPSLAHRALEHGGEGFVPTVEEHIGRFARDFALERVYGLHIRRFR